MFRRLWQHIKALLGVNQDHKEKPASSLSQIRHEVKEAQLQHRDLATDASTKVKNLEQLVDQTQKTIANLQSKAELARKNGDPGLTALLLAEKEKYESQLAGETQSLDSARQDAEDVKASIRSDNKRIYHKFAEEMRPTGLD